MKLTKENIQDWKKSFDEIMLRNFGFNGYSETEPDEHWLENYEGWSAISAAKEEIENIQD